MVVPCRADRGTGQTKTGAPDPSCLDEGFWWSLEPKDQHKDKMQQPRRRALAETCFPALATLAPAPSRRRARGKASVEAPCWLPSLQWSGLAGGCGGGIWHQQQSSARHFGRSSRRPPGLSRQTRWRPAARRRRSLPPPRDDAWTNRPRRFPRRPKRLGCE